MSVWARERGQGAAARRRLGRRRGPHPAGLCSYLDLLGLAASEVWEGVRVVTALVWGKDSLASTSWDPAATLAWLDSAAWPLLGGGW